MGSPDHKDDDDKVDKSPASTSREGKADGSSPSPQGQPSAATTHVRPTQVLWETRLENLIGWFCDHSFKVFLSTVAGVVVLFVLYVYFKAPTNNTVISQDSENPYHLKVDIVSIDPSNSTANLDFQLAVETTEATSDNIVLAIMSVYTKPTTLTLVDYQDITLTKSETVYIEKHRFYPKDNVTVKVKVHSQGIYPFDTYLDTFCFYMLQEGTETLTPSLGFSTSEKRINIYSSSAQTIPIERYTCLAVSLRRPGFSILLSLVAPILLVLVTLLAVYWQCQRNDKRIEILVLNITIFLGIPDIRGLLIPPELAYAPLVDLLLLISVILSFVGLLIYLRRFFDENEGAKST